LAVGFRELRLDSITVLPNGEGAFGLAGQGVEHAEVMGGVLFELILAGSGAEATRLLAKLSNRDLHAGE
jgi:hypothetical protein